MVTYSYSASQMRYRNVATGRYVPDADIRNAVEQVAQRASDAMARLTERLHAGDLSVDAWRGEMAAQIKLAHLSIGMVGHGGRAAMDPSKFGYLGSVIKGEYAYLNTFADAIANGTARSDRQIVARARLYAETARLTFEHVRDRDAMVAGLDQERNVMGGAEHCAECPSLSALGWVPAGTLPPVGARSCRMRCRCSIARRASPQRVQEAA